MNTLMNRLAFASGIFLAAAGVFDIALSGTPHESYLLFAFALFLVTFFCVIAPAAILYTIIKLAVRDAKKAETKL